MRKWIRSLVVVAFLGSLFVGTGNAATPLMGMHRTLASGRTYWLSGSGPELVVGFPGSNLSAENLNDGFWSTGNPATTGWQRHAAANGYTLALAEPADPAHGSSWNVGHGWPSGPQDDVTYALEIVADAVGIRGLPFDSVYAAGFSAGGAMAWRMVADHPELFLACFSAAGWAPYYPLHPMDCWHTHGTGDTTVPVRGGFVSIFPYTFPPAYQEQSLTMRGSRVVIEVGSGGHASPGWTAGRAIDFFRNR